MGTNHNVYRAALFVLFASACDDDEKSVAPLDAAVGEEEAAECVASSLSYPGRVAQAKRSPDGKGFCCEPGPPSCNCGFFGGFVQDLCECGKQSALNGVCDLAPPDWAASTDEHGCSVYRARTPTTQCCNCPRYPDGGRI